MTALVLRYCPLCRGSLTEKELPTQDRPRLTCDSCGYILYRNPKVVAGTIPQEDNQVYLLRRGLEPRRGTWTFPAGYLEWGETTEEAALRETLEETGLGVDLESLLNVYSRPEAGVVVVVYLARVVRGKPTLGLETLEIRAFGPEDMPWEDLSFPSTRWALADWVRRSSAAEAAHTASPGPG